MFGDAAPDRLGLPGAVHRSIDSAGVELLPALNHAAQKHCRSNALHRRVVGDHRDLHIFTGSHNGRRIGVMCQHVGLLTDERLGGIGFLARIVPSRSPDYANFNIGIDALSAKRIGIDALEDFGNRNGSDVTQNVRLRHRTGEFAGKITRFIKAGRIVGHVGRSLITRSMLELNVRELLGNLKNRVHVAERGRKDELVALLREVAKHAFAVSSGGNVLYRRELYFVAIYLFERDTGEVVLTRPAFLTRRTHIDESHFVGARSFIGGSGSGLFRCGSLFGCFGFVAAAREHRRSGAGQDQLQSSTLLHHWRTPKTIIRTMNWDRYLSTRLKSRTCITICGPNDERQ